MEFRALDDLEIESLYKAVIHLDQQLYRPVRVCNKFQLLLEILNHALEIHRLKNMAVSVNIQERNRKLVAKREEEKKIKGILMKAVHAQHNNTNFVPSSSNSTTSHILNPLAVNLTSGGDEIDDNNETEAMHVNATEKSEETTSTAMNVEHLSFWSKGFLLKLFGVESELMRRALKSFRLDDALDYQKLQQRRNRMKQFQQQQQQHEGLCYDTQKEVTGSEIINFEECNSSDIGSISQQEVASLVYGTKNYRVTKQRIFFAENGTGNNQEQTMEFEETNASIPLTLREAMFSNHIGREMYLELSELLQRLEIRLMDIAETLQKHELWSYIFQLKSIPVDNPNPSIRHFPATEYGKQSDLVNQLVTIILYIHFFCGVILGKGYGEDKREDLAFQHFLFAADHGLDLCQGEVGHYYDSDHPVVFDFEMKYEKISGQCYELNYLQVHDPFTIKPKDLHEKPSEQLIRLKKLHALMARRYYKLSADQGYAITQSIYALLMEVVDPTISVSYYEMAAAQGLREALFNLGNSYSHGMGVEVDIAKALSYYERAALLGDPDAMLNIAVAHVNGTGGVQKDCEKAVKYFRIAAEQGNSTIAWYNLGIMYLRGSGVQQDVVQSTQCFLVAANMGYPAAQQRIAACYEVGHGCQIDLEKAAKYCLQAADNGIGTCIRRIVIKLVHGHGIERDLYMAYYYLLKLQEYYIKEDDGEGLQATRHQIDNALNNAWPLRRKYAAVGNTRFLGE